MVTEGGGAVMGGLAKWPGVGRTPYEMSVQPPVGQPSFSGRLHINITEILLNATLSLHFDQPLYFSSY